MRGRQSRELAPSAGLVSLFCGAGGLDLGFEQANYEVAAAFDLRRHSIDSYNHNRDRAVGHVADVTALTPAVIERLAGRKLAPLGIIGGPPCQSFSRAAHSADDDHRHELPFEFVRILSAFNRRSPVSFFAFENVPGLLKERHSARYSRILTDLAAAGFEVTSCLINASAFGVPQDRPRLIIVGINKKLLPGRRWLPPQGEKEKVVTVRSAIGKLPPPIYWTRDAVREKIPYHLNHWCMTPKSKNFFTKGALVPGTSRGRSFRTLDWDRPSPTVAYGNREVHVHPEGKRRLSVFEAMILQGFPRSYQLLGSLSDQITQVSEAVPPPLAKAIANSIRACLALPPHRIAEAARAS